MLAMLKISSLLLLLTACTTGQPIVVIDCNPLERQDCRSISPEAVMALGTMVEQLDMTQERLLKCEDRKYNHVNTQ